MSHEAAQARGDEDATGVADQRATRAGRLDSDSISIRGVTLSIPELVEQSFFDPERESDLGQQLQQATPFPHLVLDGLFNPRLLELVIDEFSARCSETEMQRDGGSASDGLGPASQTYFNVVNSGWFTEWLSTLAGIPYLLPDPKLFGGGLLETRPGPALPVRRGLPHRRHLGLRNELAMITYLNTGWQSEWGSLELWNQDCTACVKRIQPDFGRTLIVPLGKSTFYGTPAPLQAPNGRPLRSIAVYYYTSPTAETVGDDETASIFMHPRRSDQIKAVIRNLTPPFVWAAIRKLKRR